MRNVKGFLKVKRQAAQYRPVCERVKDYSEVNILPSQKHSQEQASRCMDCGTPFCHWGCPIGNYIPEWNAAVSEAKWGKAFSLLNATNNLPEITGRICPATCEYACVLGINDDPVTIRENELSIIEDAFKRGLIRPMPPKKRTKKKVAVIGSGPAGWACADQLNKAGHTVAVFERDDKIGGIMRYGIPDFKLEKWVLDRRIKILEKEGIEFVTGTEAGKDISMVKIKKEFDAICLCCGSRMPRDLNIEGRNLQGIYFAMDYLIQSNRRVQGRETSADELIDAKNKAAVVIGGGDTGADCVGAVHRQGAKCVIQIELLPQPQTCRTENYPWPKYPVILKTSTSHQEGGERQWSILTKKFVPASQKNSVGKLLCAKVDAFCKETPGTEFEIPCDLVILALGFLRPQKTGLISELNLELTPKGNVKTDDSYMTSQKGIFSAGDMRRGQSLIVWAISEGRQAACQIDKYLEYGYSFKKFSA